MNADEAYAAVRADHLGAGQELRLRHQAAAAAPSGARSPRSTRSPAGSTTSATATCPPRTRRRSSKRRAARCRRWSPRSRTPPDEDPAAARRHRPGARRADRRRHRASRSRSTRSSELIDGCLADVNQATYKTFDDLLWYCRCVAGSIGRLSLGIYGATPPGEADQDGRRPGRRAAAHEHPAGRPRGLPEQPRLPAGGGPGQVRHRVRPVRRARAVPDARPCRRGSRTWSSSRRAAPASGTARGLRLLATIDRRSAACTGAMAGIYRRLLERIARQPARGARGPDVPARQREGPGRGAGAGRLRPLEVPQGGRPR